MEGPSGERTRPVRSQPADETTQLVHPRPQRPAQRAAVLDDVSPRSSPPLPAASESVPVRLSQELADAFTAEEAVVSDSGSDLGRMVRYPERGDEGGVEPILSDSGSEGGVAIDNELEDQPTQSEHEGGVETEDQPAESEHEVDDARLLETENQRPRDWFRRRSQSVSNADTKLSERVVRLRYDSLWYRQ